MGIVKKVIIIGGVIGGTVLAALLYKKSNGMVLGEIDEDTEEQSEEPAE